MDDLVQWLSAQLDEDERIVKAAPRGPWSMDSSGSIVAADGARVIPSVGGALDGRAMRWPEGSVADYVVTYGPARVLRQIDATRQLLHRYAEVADMDRDDAEPEFAYGRAVGLGEAVRLRALPYADRPGYREEWWP